MSETVNNFYQRSLSALVVTGINGTQLNQEAITNLSNVVSSASLTLSAEIKDGFSAVHKRDIALSLELGKAANLTKAELNKIKGGQLSILTNSEQLKAHVNEIKASCQTYFDSQAAKQAEEAYQQQRRADRQSAMSAISLVGSFGQMTGSQELVVTAQIASTTMEVVDAFQNAVANTLSGFLNPMVAAGQGVLTLIQLFSGPKPDPVMEQLKILSQKIDALRYEVQVGFTDLKQGQKQIFKKMCRGFTEVISMVSGGEQRITDLIRVRLDRLSSNMHFLHEILGAQVSDLLMRELETLSITYSTSNLQRRLTERSIDQVNQDLERLHSWAIVQSIKPIHNGLKIAQPELNTEVYPANRFIHAAKHIKPLDMLAFLIGYIKTNTDFNYGSSREYQHLPNFSVWLTAIISISKLLTHCSEAFLAKNKATIETYISDTIRIGNSLKTGLEAINSVSLMRSLTAKYTGEFAHARQLFSVLVSTSNQGQTIALTDILNTRIDALPEFSVATQHCGNVTFPGLFAWSEALSYGGIMVSQPQAMTADKARTADHLYNGGVFGTGHARYKVTIQTKYNEKITIADNQGATHLLSTQLFNRHIKIGNIKNTGHPRIVGRLESITDAQLLTSKKMHGYTIGATVLSPNRNEPTITIVVNGIKQVATSTQNRLRKNAATAVIEGTGIGANLFASLERLEALRLCLYAVLDINDSLPENTDRNQFLLSRDAILTPFRAVVAAQGGSVFPSQLGADFNQAEINTILASISDPTAPLEQTSTSTPTPSSSSDNANSNTTTSSIATLAGLLNQLEITRDYVNDTINAIPPTTLAEYRSIRSGTETQQALFNLTGQMRFMATLMRNTFSQMDPSAVQNIMANTMRDMQQSGTTSNVSLSGAMFTFLPPPSSESSDAEQVITPLEQQTPTNT